ncbi:MAG: hypothetical protein WDA16_05615 [Candidatus Thermoplasmatota archaeon]
MKFNGWTILSLVLLLLGAAFWLYMGTTYNNWTDVGVYAVGVTLIGFGLVGMLVSLMRPTPPVA